MYNPRYKLLFIIEAWISTTTTIHTPHKKGDEMSVKVYKKKIQIHMVRRKRKETKIKDLEYHFIN